MDLLENLKWCDQEWAYPNIDEDCKTLLEQCLEQSVTENPPDSVDELIEKSNKFPISFPIDTPRLIKLKETRPLERLQKNIKSTYTLIHSRVLVLMARFLIYKRKHGTAIEKELYKDITIPLFIDRLLKKRAGVFIGAHDRYTLLSGETSMEGWENIGLSDEKPPLTLYSCLSYDEMKISAMVYISGHTECINNGHRHNAGKPSDDNVQLNARIIGLIGPRLRRQGRMEYEDCIISKSQNCPKNGFGLEPNNPEAKSLLKKLWEDISKGFVKKPNAECERFNWRKLWADFYQVPIYTYDEIASKVPKSTEIDDIPNYTKRFVPIKDKVYLQDVIFDNEVYYKRIRILAECALLEADSVAAEEGTTAYLNIVGCGLGVWRICLHQSDVYVLTFLETIRDLLEKSLLKHVTDVNFAYIKSCHNELFNDNRSMFMEHKDHPKGGINVTLVTREPSSKLTGEHENKLLVITYPWDSNAHPGNEFWLGSLTSSGDPAAASSTQVAELHNAHINPHVNGNNVKVAGDIGIKPLSAYCEKITKAENK